MRIYNVRVLRSAEADIDNLADFLFEKLSREGAYRYLHIEGDTVYVDRILPSKTIA